MLAVPLIFYKEEHKIVRLMELIKNHYGRGKAPAAFKLPDDIKATIPQKILTYLKRNTDDESVDPHLFEFYVYRKMYQHLDKGRRGLGQIPSLIKISDSATLSLVKTYLMNSKTNGDGVVLLRRI